MSTLAEAPNLHAEPDGQFHWTAKDERHYREALDASEYVSSSTKDLWLQNAQAGDAVAAHTLFFTQIRHWEHGLRMSLHRVHQRDLRTLLYVATRLHHPALLDVLVQAPAEAMLRQAWLDACARWPLLCLRHALLYPASAQNPQRLAGLWARIGEVWRTLLDSRVEQVLTTHPDWAAPLAESLRTHDAGAEVQARLAQIVARVQAVAVGTAAHDLPELLREPPWRRARPPSAKEKAAQPWLRHALKPPSALALITPTSLPAPCLQGSGAALAPQAVADLLHMLALGKPGAPWAGLAEVLPAFSADSLARFGRALWASWARMDEPVEHKWMLLAQGVLGDADSVDALSEAIADWPSAGKFHLAKDGLLTLGLLGTRGDAVGEAALRALLRFAEKGKPSLRQPARGQLERAAAAIGMSADELADRLVPDLGLSTDADFRFDLGARVHTLHFDEHLLPFVRDADGKRLKDLPRPRIDDGDCTDTVARWKALKKAAKALASEQIARMEQALVRGRSWAVVDFERLFQRHPLLRQLGQRLLWVTHAPGTADVLLRIAEDFTLLDVDDASVRLPATARLSLAHPIDLDAATLARWGQLWADYALLPPFPQLGRPVFRLSDAEIVQSATLARCTGWGLATGSLLGLLNKHGWQRLADGAWVYGLRLPLGDGESSHAVLQLAGGFDIAEPHTTPTQTIERFGFEGASTPRQRSEALYALEGCRVAA